MYAHIGKYEVKKLLGKGATVALHGRFEARLYESGGRTGLSLDVVAEVDEDLVEWDYGHAPGSASISGFG